MKILVATEKPFAAQAVNEMKKVIADSGNEMILLEKGTKDDLIKAVADADGLIVRSDIVDKAVMDAAPRVARIAKGFGMRVSALDPFVKDEVMIEEGIVPMHSVEELYSQNDIVSLHIPATPATKKSVNKALVSLLPKKGILINTARKEVIDEESLAEALAERTDIKYIADIKPDIADKLAKIAPGRVFFTPKKMGAQTAEANINAGIAAACQINAFFKDGCTKFKVN